MAIKFHDDTNNDGLFDQIAKLIAAQIVVETARSTTIPATETDIYDRFNLLPVDPELEAAIGGIPAAYRSNRSSFAGLMSALSTAIRNLIIELVNDDTPLPRKTIDEALAEAVRQMVGQSETLNAPSVGVTVTPDVANAGDGVLIASSIAADGRPLELMIAESLTGVMASGSIRLRSAPRVNLLDAGWPAGSGANRTIAPQSAGGLLTNGGFDDETVVPNAPDGWIVSVGTIGTTLKLTDPEVQTIAISGSPEGGHYVLHWTDAGNRVYSTIPIAWDASSSTVQSALRSLPGLSLVTVTQSGVSPNLTHTVTFEGLGGDVAEFTSTNNLTGGSSPAITHDTTTGGTAYCYDGGRALEFDSNGSELTTINQRLQLQPSTVYAVNLWAIADVVPAAGAITVDLVDGIGGTVIDDDAGTSNTVSFDADELDDTDWLDLPTLSGATPVFRTPAVLPPVVYLRIRISTAVSSGTSVFLDRASLVPMVQLYSGGPYVAAFAGSTPFAPTDRWAVVTTNDRGGVLLEWLHRNFDLARLGLRIPTDGSGNETIPDSIVT